MLELKNLGIRENEPKEFVKFFKLVESKASNLNKVFFMQTGECEDVKFNNLLVDTLYGWLIPQDMENDFKNRYLKNKTTIEDDKFYVRVDWKIENNELKIDFN
ncbi:MAG: hypothetical protein SOZ89_03350 [Peptoniphilaceae bacterium]|nr:hypothetical protein [Peptoniphilaceae bacterium]MDD7383855.1 hypothetical protein [Peptoniphilaceae bacterium]MDY3738142.1 hypothetical protein [Peptoniphilaceae bacterium]MDY6018114.1 hypothetical protein [Anaerococcus sp.]